MTFPACFKTWLLSLASAAFALPLFASTNLSVWVFPDSSGHLISKPDALGNRILDQSGVGFGGGTVPLPATNIVPVKIVVTPVAGDNVSNIQAAINYVSALPLDTNGFRGAVLLSNGVYQCASQIKISASGIVLRGQSSATNGSGVVLEATATNQYTLIEITGSGSASSGTTHTITNLYVPAGARSFFVDDASGLAVGSEVYVRRVATSNWISDLGMNLLGPPPDVPWTVSDYMMDMDRVITHIEGNHIFLDAPITCAIDALHYTNGTIRPFTWSGRITNVGLEHIFGKSDYFGSNTNETHGWTFIQFDKVVNGWVRDVNEQYFGYSCVNLNSGDKFITVQDCSALDPVSIITGGRRYAFTLNDAPYCLVKNCYTRQDRHQFVTESVTMGPIVFVDGTSDSAHAEAGPHQRWATGILWDNITVHGGNNDIQNAGNYGTGHGWEGANCVIWNNAASGFIVQNPPGANNWLIGSVGPIQTGTAWNIGYTNMPHAAGNYDSTGSTATNVYPDSIYFNQLQDRLAAPGSQMRDYWLGNIDSFAGLHDVVALDLNWSNSVKQISGGQPLDTFNVTAGNHWIPFTFNFTPATGERITAATLTLAMRATSSANNDVLYIGATNNSLTFSNLGWLPVGTGTNTTVRVLDLGGQLSWLTNSQLNVAAQGDLGIDWAMLELQVAPAAVVTTNTLGPVADATVRGGTSAGNNFGTTTNLTVRQDASANNQQQSYLRWDLSGVSGKVYQARVVLTPLSTGANGIEQGIAVANSNNWSEGVITWNNQPNGGERFATWIPATNGQVSFDVTPQVLDSLQNDRQLSLKLFSVTTNAVDYASRENANTASRPQLVLSLAGTVLSVSGIADRTISPGSTAGPISFTLTDSANVTFSIVGSSSNPSLVPGTNVVFGGSGTNRTVTVTPLAGQNGITVITILVTDSNGQTAGISFTLTVSSHNGAKLIWNGPGAGSNNWSNTNYWSPTFSPEFLDDVKFFDAGAAGVAISNLNSFVDLNFGGTIASLQIGNTNGNHTIRIADGQSLELSGANGLIIGTETDNGSVQQVNATFTGLNGSLSVVNEGADFIVRQGSTGNSSQRATLDLSGLGNLFVDVSQLLVGVAGPVNRPVGTLYLARTNSIATAAGSLGINAGDSGSNGGSGSFIYLGLDNEIFADDITIGRQKCTATLAFNPAFTNASPQLVLRGFGPDRVSEWDIGDFSAQSVSGSTTAGTVDLSGGSVDILADTIFVAKGQTSSGSGSTTGTLTLTDGTLDVNTLEAGYQNSSAAAAVVTGTVNVRNNAQLVVNSTLRLARYTGSGTLPVGTLNIFGGTVAGDGDILAGGGNSTIAVNNGTLGITGSIGTPATPVTKVALTNSTLQFSVDRTATNLVATTLVTGGTSNLISVISLPAVSTPVQIPLLDYSNPIAGAGFNFVLARPVSGGGFSAYLSNNLANSSVDLLFVSSPAMPPNFSSARISGTNLVFGGTNGIPNWPFYVLSATNLAQPQPWPDIATNSFDGAGAFIFTNTLSTGAGQRFYQLQIP
jgi:hypothetical protein